MIRSFDIFDTVITRTVGRPETIFLRLGRIAAEMGLINISPQQFRQLRVRAETEARQKKSGGEVTLEEIYQTLSELAKFPPEIGQKLLNLELDIEDTGFRPVRIVADEVARARQAHGRVAFLSDMYLPKAFLEKKLRAYGLFQDGDLLLISAEQGATKQSGELYRRFLRNAGLKPSELLHRGDNWFSDVQTPKRLGIRTAHFDTSALNRYERILEQYTDEIQAMASYFAGASRLVRLESKTNSPQVAAIRDVAAGVAGPTLLSFVVWVLQRADQLKLKRIYFLARDGQILLELARLAAPVLGFGGDLKYLYASRQAFRLPATDTADPQSLRWCLDDTTFLSIESFLERLELSSASLENLLRRHGLDPSTPSKNLDKAARQKLSTLTEDLQFREAVAPIAKERRRLLEAYLQQEGVLGSDDFGIVDLGWHGTLQTAMERLLRDKKAALPVGFYFGLSNRATQGGIGKYEAFFFDEWRQTGYCRRAFWVEPMLEVFCTANHGTTLRFEASGNRIVPVLKTPCNDNALAWGLVALQKAILAFAGSAIEGYFPGFQPELLLASINALLEEFWNRPSPVEVEAWGDYPYADDQTEAHRYQLAEPFGPMDWLRSVYRAQITPPHRAGWIAGGLMKSPKPIQWTLRPAVKLSSWLRHAHLANSN